jgi:dienelactone hydrolase
MRFALFAILLLAISTAPNAYGELRPKETGKVTFTPQKEPNEIDERYRLGTYEFAYELVPHRELTVSGVEIYKLTFPSPVKSPHPENNIVHAEYYRPAGDGKFPAVIVLDILGGDQSLSRNMAQVFAQNRIAALFVQMAYYGPRKPAKENVRLLSTDVERTMAAIRQTVLDNRCATAWLESRPEVDGKKLGILGTSLGSFMGALTAAAEPRLNKVALLLGGGNLVDSFWDHPQAKPYIAMLDKAGVDKSAFKKLIAPADPLTYAENLKKRDLLMIAASRDDVVPPTAAKALWEATGKQKIVWLNATHVGAVIYIFDAVEHIMKHFKG